MARMQPCWDLNQSSLAQEPMLLATLPTCLFMVWVNMQKVANVQGADAQCLSLGGSSSQNALHPSNKVSEHESAVVPIRRTLRAVSTSVDPAEE